MAEPDVLWVCAPAEKPAPLVKVPSTRPWDSGNEGNQVIEVPRGSICHWNRGVRFFPLHP